MPPLMSVFLMMFGLILSLAFLGDFRTALRSKRHIKTQGKLKRSWIEQHGEMNSNRQFYMPMVIYEFTVAGRKYGGRNWRLPARSLRTRWEAEEALSIYVKETPLSVWYDPDAPNISYLKKTHPIDAAFPVLFGCILVACGFLGLVFDPALTSPG